MHQEQAYLLLWHMGMTKKKKVIMVMRLLQEIIGFIWSCLTTILEKFGEV
jgi:tryptophan-rich sensory protein